MKEDDNVFNAVSRVTGISKKKMTSRTRKWTVVEARMLFVLFMSRRGNIDDMIAGARRRNRTTIVKSLHTAADYIDISRAFQEKYNKVEKVYEAAQSL